MKQLNPGNRLRVTATARMLLTVSLAFFLCQASAVSASTLFGEILRSSEPASGTAFGYSVSISGETAAVGEWFDIGVVNILQLDSETGSWQEVQRIETPEEQSGQVNFGFSTWLDGDQLVVGAPTITLSRPGAVSGYAYIYERNSDDGSWTLVRSIAGQFPEPGEFVDGRLGGEVVVDQGRALIVRKNEDDTSAVLIYERDSQSGEWLETGTIAIGGDSDANLNEAAEGHTVSALALDGNQLAISVSEKNTDGTNSRVVRIFEFDETQEIWIETDRLDQFDMIVEVNTFLGLALDNGRLLVSGEAGARLLQRDSESGQWVEDENFTEDVSGNLANERQASDIDGSRVVVAGVDGVGLLVYERDGLTGRWVESFELSTEFLGDNSPTVTALDLEGDHVLAGIPYVEQFTGALFSFRLDDPDSDGIPAIDDNCPADFNPTQANFDDDLLGDACDLDDDNDTVADDEDAFPLDPDRQEAPVSAEAGEAPLVPFPVWPFGNGVELETDFRWPMVSDASFYVIEVQHGDSIRAYEPMIAASTACSNNTCAYVKTDAVLNGANRWRLRAGNAAGVSEWSAWADFFVGLPADSSAGGGNNDAAFAQLPAVPVPQQPVGDGQTEGVDFVWAAVPGVIRYSIEVQHQGNIRAYEPSLPANEACAVGVCRYIKTDATRIGENRWRLRAINDVGASGWSEWANFAVENAQINNSDAFVSPVPFPASPLGSTDSQVVDYRWAEVTGATVYAIEIQHNESIRGYAGDILPSEACSSSGCVFSKEDAALPGENRWRVRSGTADGFSEWSEWQMFTL